MDSPTTASSRTSALTESAASKLASRTTRRSFLGRLARISLVAVGTPFVLGVTAEQAFALDCDCAGPNCDQGCGPNRSLSCQRTGHSVTCKGLTGSGCPATGGVGGRCPNNTRACGSWTCTGCSVPGCPGNVRTWIDCCATGGQCDNASSSRCVCDVDGFTRATCKNHHCYDNGGGGGCSYIRCRYSNC